MDNDRVDGHYWTFYVLNPNQVKMGWLSRINEGFRQVFGTLRYMWGGQRVLMLRIWTYSFHTLENLEEQLQSLTGSLIIQQTEPDEPATGDYMQQNLQDNLVLQRPERKTDSDDDDDEL